MIENRLHRSHPYGISIIISSSNTSRYLVRFIESFTANNRSFPVEMIIPHNKQTEFASDLRDNLKQFMHITFVACSPTESDFAMNNHAVKQALYPHLLFIDSSINYNLDVLPAALAELNNPRIGIVGIQTYEYSSSISGNLANTSYSNTSFRWNHVLKYFEPYQHYLKDISKEKNQLSGNPIAVNNHFMLCRKKDFIALNGFYTQNIFNLSGVEFCLKMNTKLKKECCYLKKFSLPISLYERATASRPAAVQQKTANHKRSNIRHLKKSDRAFKQFNGKTAVIGHIYYFDQWPYLSQMIKNIPINFQLFVTVSDDCNDNNVNAILQAYPEAKVSRHPNQGRDIAPFLEVLKNISNKDYQLVCKVHTKKSDPVFGDVWRQLMLHNILDSPQLVADILKSFANNPNLGMVGPSKLYKSVRSFMLNNLANLLTIRKLMNMSLSLPEDWGFFAGSCFWLRPGPLVPLAETLQHLQFEEDNSKKDGQLAHALERYFGLNFMEAGFDIGLIDNTPDLPGKPSIEIINSPGKPCPQPIKTTLYKYLAQTIANTLDRCDTGYTKNHINLFCSNQEKQQ